MFRSALEMQLQAVTHLNNVQSSNKWEKEKARNTAHKEDKTMSMSE